MPTAWPTNHLFVFTSFQGTGTSFSPKLPTGDGWACRRGHLKLGVCPRSTKGVASHTRRLGLSQGTLNIGA